MSAGDTRGEDAAERPRPLARPLARPVALPLALIAGWTCSGKTRFARALAEALRPARAAVLSQDDYYRDTSRLTHAQKVRVNHDLPEALDLPLFAEHLAALCSGGTVPRLAYDFAAGARRAEGTRGPADFVLAEGVRVFRLAPPAHRPTVRILLEGTPDRLLARRIRRDTEERGYTEAETRRRFAEMALPAQREALSGAATEADFVFPMDWGAAEVAAAASRLAGDTSAPERPSA